MATAAHQVLHLHGSIPCRFGRLLAMWSIDVCPTSHLGCNCLGSLHRRDATKAPSDHPFFFSLRMLLAEVWGRWEDGVTQSRRRRRSSGDCFSEMGARISAAANILVTKQPLAKVGAMGKRQVQPIKPSESHEHANRCSTSPLVKPGKRNNPTRRRTKRVKTHQPWPGS